MSGKTHTEKLQSSALVAELCCECGCEIPAKEEHWLLACEFDGKKLKFRTCGFCHGLREEHIKEGMFHPGYLAQDLANLRAKLSYDDSFHWAKLTNAVAALRARQRTAQRAKPQGVPPYSPTPLNGVRVISGGWRG